MNPVEQLSISVEKPLRADAIQEGDKELSGSENADLIRFGRVSCQVIGADQVVIVDASVEIFVLVAGLIGPEGLDRFPEPIDTRATKDDEPQFVR